MTKRKRPPQITCYCHAYGKFDRSTWNKSVGKGFPHRLGSGRCTVSSWVASYRLLDGSLCQGCNNLNCGESGAGGERYGTCDVEEGLESHETCEAYIDFLHSQNPLRIPMDEDDYFKQMAENAYGYEPEFL